MQQIVVSILVIVFLSACEPNEYLTNQRQLEGEWKLSIVNVSAYPFEEEMVDWQQVKISLTKRGNMELKVNDQSSIGEYRAEKNGRFKFRHLANKGRKEPSKLRHYIVTLIKKVISYKQEEDRMLLFINDKNYLVFEKEL